ESWWGPGGFVVKVRKLDLRPGGELLYAMTAIDPPQVEFMKTAGMPVTTEARIRFTEVEPPHRLAYVHLADFITGVDPYDVATLVELNAKPEGVHMILTFDAMHDDVDAAGCHGLGQRDRKAWGGACGASSWWRSCDAVALHAGVAHARPVCRRALL